MPLTKFQEEIIRHLAKNRAPDSHLAGGAALHFEPNSKRYSNDLDFFHDSQQKVADAFDQDRKTLEGLGFDLVIEITQPGYIRAQVKCANDSTKIEWAHDSAWRFMPPIYREDTGYFLHPIDLAINKILALAGRDELRDFIDVLHIHKNILPLGALCWAAVGKDPGFTPLSLLELLKRRGKYRPDDLEKLMLTETISLTELKQEWLKALDEADKFIRSRPFSEIGCLYYSKSQKQFVDPSNLKDQDEVFMHYGGLGGIIPKVD